MCVSMFKLKEKVCVYVCIYTNKQKIVPVYKQLLIYKLIEKPHNCILHLVYKSLVIHEKQH